MTTRALCLLLPLVGGLGVSTSSGRGVEEEEEEEGAGLRGPRGGMACV